jgi:hypothetical protein
MISEPLKKEKEKEKKGVKENERKRKKKKQDSPSLDPLTAIIECKQSNGWMIRAAA